MTHLTHTDLFKSLKREEEILIERVAHTEGKWHAHWRDELEAVRRCLWALSLSPYLKQV